MQVSGFSHRAKRLLHAPGHVDIAFGWLAGRYDPPDQPDLNLFSSSRFRTAVCMLSLQGVAAEDDEQHDASADLCRAEARG